MEENKDNSVIETGESGWYPAAVTAAADVCPTNETAEVDCIAARRSFSTAGWGVFVFLAVSSALQILLSAIGGVLDVDYEAQPWLFWMFNFAPIYVIGAPLCLLILRKVPKTPCVTEKMGAGKLIVAAFICFFLMYSGSFLGLGITSAVQGVFGIEPVNVVQELVFTEQLLPKILVIVIIGPFFEELIFRKALISRLRVYGERLAVITSAVIFALFHGNLSQMFYAFLLGLVFGYIYLRSGKLRNSLILHMIVNFSGSIVAPYMLGLVDESAMEGLRTASAAMDPAAMAELITPGMIAFALLSLLLAGLFITGLVLFCVNVGKLRFYAVEKPLPKGKRFSTVYLNVGMLLLILACLALVVLTFVV